MIDLHRQKLANRPPRGSMRSTSAKVAGWIAVGALYLGLTLVYAWNHWQLLDLQYRVQELRGANSELRETKDALRAEWETRTRPGKIAAAAREMGLVSANQADVTVIQADPATDALRAEVQPQRDLLHE